MARLMSSAAALLLFASAVVCNASEVPSFGSKVTFNLERPIGENSKESQTLFLDFERGVYVVRVLESGLEHVQMTQNGLTFQFVAASDEEGFESPECRVAPSDELKLESKFESTDKDGNSVFTLSLEKGDSVQYVEGRDGTPQRLGDWTVLSSSEDFDSDRVSAIPSTCFTNAVDFSGNARPDTESVARLQAIGATRAELYKAKAKLQSGGSNLHPPWNWSTDSMETGAYMNNGIRWDEPNLIDFGGYNDMAAAIMGYAGINQVVASTPRAPWATQPIQWQIWTNVPHAAKTDISGTLLEGTLWSGHGNAFTAWNRLRIEEADCDVNFIDESIANLGEPEDYYTAKMDLLWYTPYNTWITFADTPTGNTGGFQAVRVSHGKYKCRVPVANNCNGSPLTYDSSYPANGITNQIGNTGQQVRWTHTYPNPFATPNQYPNLTEYYRATAFDYNINTANSQKVWEEFPDAPYTNSFSNYLPPVLQAWTDHQFTGTAWGSPPGPNQRPASGPHQARLTKCRANAGFNYDADYKNPSSWSIAKQLSDPASTWGLTSLNYNAQPRRWWADSDWFGRFHDLSPLAGGAGLNSVSQHCASDAMSWKMVWVWPSKLLFSLPAIQKCWNLRIECRARTWWGSCKSVDNGGGWQWKWVLIGWPRHDPRHADNHRSGFRFWGPVGAKYEFGKICVALRLPGEGLIGHPNKLLWSNPRIGNGICNDDLNYDFWGFDGGDCCQSTCVWNLNGPVQSRTMCTNVNARPTQYYNCCQPGCTGTTTPDGTNGQCNDPNRHAGNPPNSKDIGGVAETPQLRTLG